MILLRSDIILARLPFTDQSGAKIRPALVVQNDQNNARLDDVILVVITSNVSRAMIESTQLLIDVTTPAGRAAGLLHSSAVKCEHLMTLHRSLVLRAIGDLPDALMRQVDDCLRRSFDLP